MLLIPPEIRDQIARHAAAEFPHECCGILLGRALPDRIEISRALPARNLADAGRLHDRYVVDPVGILLAERSANLEHLELLGFYHSHPNQPATPSRTDIELAWQDYVYLIAAVAPGVPAELRAWRLNSAEAAMTEITQLPSSLASSGSSPEDDVKESP